MTLEKFKEAVIEFFRSNANNEERSYLATWFDPLSNQSWLLNESDYKDVVDVFLEGPDCVDGDLYDLDPSMELHFVEMTKVPYTEDPGEKVVKKWFQTEAKVYREFYVKMSRRGEGYELEAGERIGNYPLKFYFWDGIGREPDWNTEYCVDIVHYDCGSCATEDYENHIGWTDFLEY